MKFIVFCSHALAIEFQQRVVEAWESHGPSGHEELREAHRLLEQLKNKARGASANELPTKALPLPSSSASARSSPSDVAVNQKRLNTM